MPAPESGEAGASEEATGGMIRRKEASLSIPSSAPSASFPSGDALPSAGVGRPLEPSVRSCFEHRFGADFSSVRVHTGEEAARSAESVQAKAYTLGRSMVFGTGQYRPESPEGRRLLAHELTHVVQQGY